MKNIEEIIKPISKEILTNELKISIYLRPTRIGNNDVYIFSAKECPNLMQEVGRLRELTFREAGAGFGKKVDIDDYDINEFEIYLCCKRIEVILKNK